MDNFSNLMMIGECLLDSDRVNQFNRAIRKVVKKNHTVLDGGTGSGILAMLSAKAGAKKVYAIEINPDVARWAKKNISSNNLHSIVKVLNKDMKFLKLKKAVDVVTMEMMDTGLIAEQQVPAMNQLVKAGIIDKHTQVIPNRFETYIEFCDYNFDFYGLEMPFIVQARNDGVTKRINKTLSNKLLIHSVQFNTVNKLDYSEKLEFEAKESGNINSFVITSKIELAEGINTWGTTDMNMPVIIPIPERKVKKGDKLEFKIRFKMGHGFSKLYFDWIN